MVGNSLEISTRCNGQRERASKPGNFRDGFLEKPVPKLYLGGHEFGWEVVTGHFGPRK